MLGYNFFRAFIIGSALALVVWFSLVSYKIFFEPLLVKNQVADVSKTI